MPLNIRTALAPSLLLPVLMLGLNSSCRKTQLKSAPEATSCSTEIQSHPAPATPPSTSVLPSGNPKEPAGTDFEPGENNPVMAFQFDFGDSSWKVSTYTEKCIIDHHDRSYGPYTDDELRILYDCLVKYVAWEKQAKTTMSASFEKEIPGGISNFSTDDRFAPSAVFKWSDEPAKEETQDAFGARLSELAGKKAPEETSAHALLILHLSARDRVWGNALTTAEVCEFVVCLEQIQLCRTRFVKELGQQLLRISEMKKQEDALKNSFK